MTSWRIRLARVARLAGFIRDPSSVPTRTWCAIERLLECQSTQGLRAQWKITEPRNANAHATNSLSEAINQTKTAINELTRYCGR